MKFNKRGTELSMNVIVIAAIAILILVLLAMFVFDAFDGIKKGKGCEALNGMCLPTCAGTDYPIANPTLAKECPSGYKCCQTLTPQNT